MKHFGQLVTKCFTNRRRRDRGAMGRVGVPVTNSTSRGDETSLPCNVSTACGASVGNQTAAVKKSVRFAARGIAVTDHLDRSGGINAFGLAGRAAWERPQVGNYPCCLPSRSVADRTRPPPRSGR
jgi:hypothetical protein